MIKTSPIGGELEWLYHIQTNALAILKVSQDVLRLIYYYDLQFHNAWYVYSSRTCN